MGDGVEGLGLLLGVTRGTAPLPVKAELQQVWATLGEGDGGWVIDLSLAFLLIFLRDKVPLPILALVILKVVSALSIVFAIA